LEGVVRQGEGEKGEEIRRGCNKKQKKGIARRERWKGGKEKGKGLGAKGMDKKK